MTVSLLLANIADSISQISVSGVTVKDVDQIMPTWESTPNVLYPKPDGWISNFNVDFKSILQGTSAAMDIGYTLTYRFLGTEVGDLSTFPVAYANIVTKLVLILNALLALDAPYSGRVELIVGGVNIGPMIDPAGNQFHGADITLNIKEMQN